MVEIMLLIMMTSWEVVLILQPTIIYHILPH